MLGAIIGDTAGSVYEFHNTKNYDFILLWNDVNYTDDSVMTFAFADWALNSPGLSHEELENKIIEYVYKYPCPLGGYGGMFLDWIRTTWKKRTPYQSFGNGSAMRVSALGWLYDTLEETEKAAAISAAITHNHPEGIKGAQATAAAIFLARNGSSKEEIKKYIETTYEYDLSRTCDEIRPNYTYEESCQKTVPEAIIAFLESSDFESSIRLAVSLGGDSDTLACINGGIAEAYYKEIPNWMKDKMYSLLPEDFKSILNQLADKTSYGKIIKKHKEYNLQKYISEQERTIGGLIFKMEFGMNIQECDLSPLFPIIQDEEEARRYMEYPLLRTRLSLCCSLLMKYNSTYLEDIVGDNKSKVMESITLLHKISKDKLLQEFLEKFENQF